MGEKEETFSIRMGIEDFQMMEEFMTENGIRNRSRFIRDAIATYISSQMQMPGSAGNEDGIYVRLREIHLEALKFMVADGIAYDEEELVRKWILEKLVKPEKEKESADNAFETAKLTSRMK